MFGKDVLVPRRIKQKLTTRFSILTDMGDASLVLGMSVTRDDEKGTMTITEGKYSKHLRDRYGFENCKSAYTPGVGEEMSLDQSDGRLVSMEELPRFQSITGSVLYLGQVTRYGIVSAVNRLARAILHVQAMWLHVDYMFRCKTGQQPGLRQVDVLVYCLPCERPGWFQGGSARTGNATHCGDRTRGRSASDEGIDVLV